MRLDASLEKDMRTIGSMQYVPLTRLCDFYGLEYKWDSFIKVATVKGDGEITLRTGSDRILIDGREERMDQPVLLNGGAVFVPLSFVKRQLGSIVEIRERDKFVREPPERAVLKRFSIKRIVIDPGHGGKDVGAIGRSLRLREKNLTLSISKRLKGILEEKGIDIIMTRDRDNFLSLQKRVEIANQSGADLFVSIHVNASRSRDLRGFECYYLSENIDDYGRALDASKDAPFKTEKGTLLEHSKTLYTTLWDMALTEARRESIGLAGHICYAIKDSLTMRNRGMRSARFYVLKGCRMPSVLVEAGYISNRDEETRLESSKFLQRVTEALAKGILSYKDEYERTEGFTRNV